MIRLKYVSRMAKPLTDAEVDQITARAAAKNAAMEVTGVLFASGGLFVQVLEGPEDAVMILYEAISEDPRHKDVLLLDLERPVTQRLFPDWHMRRLSIDAESRERLEPLRAILATISEQQERIEMLKHVLEKALLRELATVIAKADLAQLPPT